jgi:hypothetical protein
MLHERDDAAVDSPHGGMETLLYPRAQKSVRDCRVSDEDDRSYARGFASASPSPWLTQSGMRDLKTAQMTRRNGVSRRSEEPPYDVCAIGRGEQPRHEVPLARSRPPFHRGRRSPV